VYRGVRRFGQNVNSAPKPRLQRTRSAPLRSPGSRKLFGELQVWHRGLPTICLCTALFVLGCETFNGRLYWAGTAPGFKADAGCEAIQPGSGSVVRVEVRDTHGGRIPGATVRFKAAQSGYSIEYHTDVNGLASAWIAPGEWHFEARLSGFYTGSHSLHLTADEACTVRFQLWLKSHSLVTVARNHTAA